MNKPSSIEPLEARIAPAFAAVFPLSSLDGTNGFKLSGVAPGDAAGYAVSDAGDVNGDGFGDVIMGAPRRTIPNSESGAAYVIFGKADGFAANLNLSTLDGTNGFKLSGVAAGDFCGFSVSGGGDVNGDGFDDVIIGAYRAGPAGYHTGASYVVFGKASGFADNLNLATLDGSNGFKLSGIDIIDFSGWSVSADGDVNGDGFDDVIVGAPFADPYGKDNAGESYVVFGKAGGFAAELDLAGLNGSNGFKLSGVTAYDNAGRRVSAAGDINGDGFDDLVIGAQFADANGRTYSGASYVVFGKASGFAANLNLSTLNGSNGFKLSGVAAGDRSGVSVSAGDINGDGFDDVIIGASRADASGTDSGASYVVFGKAVGFAANLNLSALDGSNGFKLSGAAAGDLSGVSVSAAGDINGDGVADLVIGAPLADTGGDRSGASYVVFGKAGGFAANMNLSTLDGSNGFTLSGVGVTNYSGGSVSAAGDLNGDGFDDLIVGAIGGGTSSGASYVVFGGSTASFSIGNASIAEGDSGANELTFTIILSASSTAPLSVHYATRNGTAEAGSDFSAIPDQTLSFAPGETTKTITVQVLGDTLHETDERFDVVLSQPTNGATIDEDAAVGIGIITNDDPPPVVSIAAGSLLEGNSDPSGISFPVTLSAPSGLPVAVNFATGDGTALTGSDYAAPAPGTLTFAPGETAKTVTVEVLGDTNIEDHEIFFINLSAPSGATIGTGTATGTIFNDDTALRITGPGETVEGDSGTKTFVFTIALEKESALPVTVSYATADGTATGGSDFVIPEAGAQLTFAPGELTKTISIDVLGDTNVEAHETFSVILSEPTNATIASGAATGTILNDDTLVQITDASLLEGHAGTRAMSFTVSLTAPSALAVSVNFASADGTATAGADYTALSSGTLEFAPDETTKTLTVDVLGDTAVEPSEVFSVLLSGAINAVIDDSTGLGTILDDDVTLVGPRKSTFTDADGELVTIKVSKGTLKVEDFTIFPAGKGAQLALIDFSGDTEFAGTDLKITAKKARGVVGDGLVNVGYINATGIDLGKAKVKGDLGQIDTGDGDAAKPALKSLSVSSIGARGLSTQEDPARASLHSDIAGDLRKLKVKTDIASGVVIALSGRLGSATIGGNLDAATISALGLLNPAKAADALAIGGLSIGGNISASRILAGYDLTGAAINADASIGAVHIGGDWIASNLVAGASAGVDGLFGTEDDALISGGSPAIARIASILIKGTASGTEGGVDHFGFVAQEIAAFKAGGVKLPLTPDPSNDLAGQPIGSTGDLKVREVA